MATRVVHCSIPDCQEPATYKVAAAWSDGRFKELKTYGHACADHLNPVFRAAEERRASFRAAPGESIEEIGIYQNQNGWLDWQLHRLWGLEENYRSLGAAPEGV